MKGSFMRKSVRTAVVVISAVWWVNSTQAQLTNALPLTKLEAFDTNVEVVILKASSDASSITADAGIVGVRCREITDTSTGRKEQGLSIDITSRASGKTSLLVDYDEIASLVSAIDYIGRVEVTATPLTSFDAAYTTKGGFRIAALGTRTTGTIQFGVRDARVGSVPVTFSRDEMNRLSQIINQAKGTLDSARR
jgi:hypothetical protein